MKNDKIFVLLLVILLPLTGCIDAVGEVDADSENDSDNTDYLPNYEFLTLTVEKTNDSWDRIYEKSSEISLPLVGSFSTNSGNLYSIISITSICNYQDRGWVDSCNVVVDTICGEKTYQYVAYTSASYSRSDEQMLEGTLGSDCLVYVYMNTYINNGALDDIEGIYSEIAFERIPATPYVN